MPLLGFTTDPHARNRAISTAILGILLARSGSHSVLRRHPQLTRVLPVKRMCMWCRADSSQQGGLDRHRDLVLEAGQNDGWRVRAGTCLDYPRFA